MKMAELGINEIHPSQQNTRKNYDGADMKELVASIESVGLLHPIIVRQTGHKTGEHGYEIIAGHRRFMAMKKVGKETIPAQIIEATDEDAEQIRLIENLHRQDLNPIEEATAFDQLMKSFNIDLAGVASRSDKSVAYVTRALALLSLKPKTQGLIVEGAISAAHGHQIARVEGRQRDTIETFATTKGSWNKQYPTLAALKEQIEKTVERDLSRAVFPKDVAQYGGTETPACNVCPWNTGNQNALFDGAEKGACTNPTCFTKRTNFAFKEMRDKVQAQNEKVKFVGFATRPAWSDRVEEIKGYPVIDAGKRRKDIAANPEKFGFAIVKPSRFGSKTGTQVYMVSLNKKEARTETQPDYQRQRFVGNRIEAALVQFAIEKTKRLDKKHVLQLIENEGRFAPTAKQVKEMSVDELLVHLWAHQNTNWKAIDNLKEVGLDATDVAKTAKAAAEKEYDAKKDVPKDKKS